MERPPYYVPAGMPPGVGPPGEHDGPPEGVYYYRIYAGFMAVLSGFLALAGLSAFIVPLLATSASTASPGAPAGMIIGLLYGGAGTLFFMAFLTSLLAGRHAWVHTLGTILMALTMMTLCCVPFALPVLVVWIKPETRRWYETAPA